MWVWVCFNNVHHLLTINCFTSKERTFGGYIQESAFYYSFVMHTAYTGLSLHGPKLLSGNAIHVLYAATIAIRLQSLCNKIASSSYASNKGPLPIHKLRVYLNFSQSYTQPSIHGIHAVGLSHRIVGIRSLMQISLVAGC